MGRRVDRKRIVIDVNDPREKRGRITVWIDLDKAQERHWQMVDDVGAAITRALVGDAAPAAAPSAPEVPRG